MEIEQAIMRNLMRIASNSRRKRYDMPREEAHRCRGFGHILDLLSKNDGLSQKQLADMLDIRPQSISEAITAMESYGLIRKEISEQDKRCALVYITEAGAERQAKLLEERRQNAKRIFGALDEEEKDTLLALLEKVTSALQENKEED